MAKARDMFALLSALFGRKDEPAREKIFIGDYSPPLKKQLSRFSSYNESDAEKLQRELNVINCLYMMNTFDFETHRRKCRKLARKVEKSLKKSGVYADVIVTY